MPRLILFELKKMLSRRVALAANVGVVVFLVAIMALNVTQNRTVNFAGEEFNGVEAIAYNRSEAEKHAGAVTAERAAADIAAYQEMVFSRIDRDAVGEMTGAAVFSLIEQSFSSEEFDEIYNPYWNWLLRPWRISGEEPAQTAARVTPEMAADWYGAADDLTQAALDEMVRAACGTTPRRSRSTGRGCAHPCRSPSSTATRAAGATWSTARPSSSSRSSPRA